LHQHCKVSRSNHTDTQARPLTLRAREREQGALVPDENRTNKTLLSLGQPEGWTGDAVVASHALKHNGRGFLPPVSFRVETRALLFVRSHTVCVLSAGSLPSLYCTDCGEVENTKGQSGPFARSLLCFVAMSAQHLFHRLICIPPIESCQHATLIVHPVPAALQPIGQPRTPIPTNISRLIVSLSYPF